MKPQQSLTVVRPVFVIRSRMYLAARCPITRPSLSWALIVTGPYDPALSSSRTRMIGRFQCPRTAFMKALIKAPAKLPVTKDVSAAAIKGWAVANSEMSARTSIQMR
jgi:hypothetical protein